MSICLTEPETETMQRIFMDFKEPGEFHVPMHQSRAVVFEIALPRAIMLCLVGFFWGGGGLLFYFTKSNFGIFSLAQRDENSLSKPYQNQNIFSLTHFITWYWSPVKKKINSETLT